MKIVYVLSALLLPAIFAFNGCVTVHAPLTPNKEYPPDWGELSTLGPQCKSLEGTYVNEGVVGGSTQPILLTSVLNFRSEAKTVSLTVRTRKVDQNGDSFIALVVIPEDDIANSYERDGCFCIKQTVACTQVYENYWSIPNFGLGGSQRNVYFSATRDGALIGRLQNYRADVILGIPAFRMKEPWVRFNAVDR